MERLALETILGILGNITTILLFLSPIPTFWKITKLQSTSTYSSIPYVFTLGNCLVWVFYGLPCITQNNILLITVNGFGIAMESVYLLFFILFAKGKLRVKVLSMVLLELIFYGLMITIALTLVPQEKRILYCGNVASIVNVAMYAAPICDMKMVIRSKSAESMSFLLSLCTLINSCIWLIYGLKKKDTFIMVPNSLGVLFGILQLVVYAIFHNHTKAILDCDVEATIITSNEKLYDSNNN